MVRSLQGLLQPRHAGLCPNQGKAESLLCLPLSTLQHENFSSDPRKAVLGEPVCTDPKTWAGVAQTVSSVQVRAEKSASPKWQLEMQVQLAEHPARREMCCCARRRQAWAPPSCKFTGASSPVEKALPPGSPTSHCGSLTCLKTRPCTPAVGYSSVSCLS